MKCDRRMLVCLAGGLVLSTSAWGATADAQGNPYQGIVERNVFALKPAPPPPGPDSQKPPPPKITPQGIMSMFGSRRVLLKAMVPGSKPGEPAKDTPMVLGLNQREGEIEIVGIDEAAGTITFNNHGEIQTLSLEKDGAKPPAGPAPAPFPGISAPAAPGVPAPAAALNPSRGGTPAPTVTTFGGSGSTLRNIPSRSLRLPTAPAAAPAAPAFGGGSVPVSTPTTQPAQPKGLSAEEQAAIMIVEKAANPDFPPPPPIPGISE